MSAPPLIVSIDGPSATGKSTVVGTAAATLGWVPLAEAFDRLDPTPDLRFRSDRELAELERALLEEDGRRWTLAREIRGRRLTVVTDTGFLGALTYTEGLVVLGVGPAPGSAGPRRPGADVGPSRPVGDARRDRLPGFLAGDAPVARGRGPARPPCRPRAPPRIGRPAGGTILPRPPGGRVSGAPRPRGRRRAGRDGRPIGRPCGGPPATAPPTGGDRPSGSRAVRARNLDVSRGASPNLGNR